MLGEALAWHREGPPKPPLTGDELAAELGMQPGPEMGRLLEELRVAAYAGEISGRDEALRVGARASAGTRGSPVTPTRPAALTGVTLKARKGS